MSGFSNTTMNNIITLHKVVCGITASSSGISEDMLAAFGKDINDNSKQLITNLKTKLHSQDAKLALLQEQATAFQFTAGSASIVSYTPVSFVHSPTAASDAIRFADMEAKT